MAVPKLRFKEFDQKWGVDALQDQIDFLAGYAFDSKLMSNEPQKYQLIKMSNVYQNQLDLTRNPSYWTNIDSKIEKFLLKKGDIVLTLTGTVGKTDYGYNVEIDKDDKFLLNQRLVRLRAKQDLSDSKFIQYRISTDKFFYHFFYSSKGGTGNQSNVSIEDLKLLELNFPSKEEQTKIASFLSAVDEKISQLTQKHALLSQYKQGMMQKLFSQQIRFKADDGSEFGEWENTTLDDVVIGMQSGLSRQLKDEDTGLIVLRSNNVIDNKISYEDVKYWYLDDPQGANVANYILQDRDILVNFINSMAQIGKSALYRKVLDRQIICTTNILRLQANIQKIKSEFLNYIFQTNEYQNYIQSITKPAVNQASFTTKEFKMMRFQLPCLEEQIKIANFLSAIDEKIEVVAQQIEQAKTWKKGLLQQMFV